MIYFSINSDYHYLLFLNVIDNLKIPSNNITFIVQKCSRNRRVLSSKYKCIFVEGHPASGGGKMISFKNFSHLILLKKIFTFTKEDTIIIPTEYELNNHIYALMMKKDGGKVILFDEGIGTYFNNSPIHDDINRKFAVKWKIVKYRLYLLNLGARGSTVSKGWAGYFFKMDDKLIDCFYSSHLLPIARKIPRIDYKHFNITKRVDLNNEYALFCTTDFSCFGLREEEKLLSVRTIEYLKKSFSNVFVKIHPGEYTSNSELLNFYKEFCRSQSIDIISNTLSLEEAIIKNKTKYVIASMSTSLFDAAMLGCEPIFTYHLLPNLDSFKVCDYALKSLGYNYITAIEDINCEYKSNLKNLSSNRELSEVMQLDIKTTRLHKINTKGKK
jgi:hypothetical protein